MSDQKPTTQSLDICASHNSLGSRTGSPVHALLGRFLPRLRPRRQTTRFFLPRSRVARSSRRRYSAASGRSTKLWSGIAISSAEKRARSSASASKPADRSQRALVHVEPAVDLDLQRMQPAGRPAVMLGDEAAGIGLVVGDRVAHRGRAARSRVSVSAARRRGAEAIADDEIGPQRRCRRSGCWPASNGSRSAPHSRSGHGCAVSSRFSVS